MVLGVNSQTLVILAVVASLAAAQVVSVQSAGPTTQTLVTTSKTSTSSTTTTNGHCEKPTTTTTTTSKSAGDWQYYYTRTRNHPSHLRVAEEMKNQYVAEVKYQSEVNGTKYEYYKSATTMTFDELLFETIDKIFRHRLSPFYIHHYDRDHDKRRSSDPTLVSSDACARDLLYLVEKLPQRSLFKNPFAAPEDSINQNRAVDSEQDELLTPELTAFFDSYARQEAGLFRGNTFWVGSHDQCVTRHIFDLIETSQQQQDSVESNQMPKRQPKQQVVSFKGRYCVASLKAPSWDQMIRNKKLVARNYFKTERLFQEYSRLFRLQLGICLPNSCDSTVMERHLDEIRLLAKSTLEPRFANYELIDLFCLPDETSPLRRWSNSALGFILVVSTWLALVLVATLADFLELFPSCSSEFKSRRRTSQFVRLMSLRANYLKLMHVGTNTETNGDEQDSERATASGNVDKPSGEKNRETGQDVNQEQAQASGDESKLLQIDLRFLNALKALIMFWIINGHIMLLMIQTAKNILDSDALLNVLMHFLIGATFGVDLFFTMTGFLTAYLLFNSKHAFKMKPATWVYLSFHRYWRLAPMYLLTFWFSRSVMQSLGAGPLWDYGTSSLTFRGLCNNESWWYPLTLTSNLHGLFEECMITSWYISCDMQFWLISPVFIYLLAHSPAQGWLVTVATILASAKMRYESVLSDKSARYDELVQPRADIFMRVSHDLPALYTHPQYRISAYLVGLLAGHYVYMIKSNKWSSVLTADLAARQQLAAPATANKDDDEQLNKVDGQTTTTTTTTKSANKTTERENATETTTRRRRRLSQRTRSVLAYLGLFLFTVMASSSYLLANFFPSQLLKYSKPLAGVLHSLDHLVMSLGASLLIVTMCLGQWPRLVEFLSHPNWSRLSKINYALLLLQCEAIYYQIFRYEQVPMAGTRELINILFNLLVTLYPLAFVATLVFEFPLANLEKFAMSALSGGRNGGGNKKKAKSNGCEGADDNDAQ